MTSIRLSRVTPADAADLIAANVASQTHHLPWVTSFTDQAGFDTWFARGLTGPNVGLIARKAVSNQVVGVSWIFREWRECEATITRYHRCHAVVD